MLASSVPSHKSGLVPLHRSIAPMIRIFISKIFFIEVPRRQCVGVIIHNNGTRPGRIPVVVLKLQITACWESLTGILYKIMKVSIGAYFLEWWLYACSYTLVKNAHDMVWLARNVEPACQTLQGFNAIPPTPQTRAYRRSKAVECSHECVQ